MLGLFLLLCPCFLAQNTSRRLDWAFGQGGCGAHFNDAEIQEFHEVSDPQHLRARPISKGEMPFNSSLYREKSLNALYFIHF